MFFRYHLLKIHSIFLINCYEFSQARHKDSPSKLFPVGGAKEPLWCKNNISPSFFSPIAGARLSDHGVRLLACSSALTQRE